MKYNAKVAERDAEQARISADYEEKRHRENAMRLMGSQRAQYGASGVDMSDGSPVDVNADTAIQTELDALAIRYGGKVKSNAYMDDAALSRMGAKNAMTKGVMGAGSSILTGYGTGVDNGYWGN
jgi:hypothetical protein